MVRAIRGATTVKNNSSDEIYAETKKLLLRIISENNISHEDMVSMIFTVTPELDACFPAAAAREAGYSDVPLMCMSEIPVKGALKNCIRILVHVNSEKALGEIKHIYLNEAVKLRKDLINNTECGKNENN